MTARLESMLLSLLSVLAAVYCFYVRSPGEVAALLLPVLVHELSHAAALGLLGFRIRGLRLEPQGLCIRYKGVGSNLAHAAASLAGPAGGLLYAALLRSSQIPWLSLSADVSLLFSFFNLLPLMPLDGGRAFLILCNAVLGEAGEDLFRSISRVMLAIVLLYGVYAAFSNRGSAPLLAALWLLLLQKEQLALVNNRDLL